MSGGDKSSCARRGEAITTVVVWLLLGAIVSVAVAWGLAAIPVDRPLEEIASAEPIGSEMRYDWILVAQRRTFGRTQNWFQGPVVNDTRLSTDGCVLTETHYPTCGNCDSGPWDIDYPIRTAAWSRLGLVKLGRSRLYIEAEIASGWPAVAFWGWMAAFDRDTGEKMHAGCIGLGEWQTVEYVESRETCLPLRPLWPGFAINTVFYAVILWLLFAAPFALRRWRRIKRGLCPKCAYDLRGRATESNVCTECGRPLPSPSR